MPIDKSFAGACPFLLESDVVRLQDFLVPGGCSITDVPLDISHRTSKEGSIIVGSMQADHTVGALRQLAARNAVNGRQFDDLIGFINVIGGLRRRRRTMRQRLDAATEMLQSLRLGIRYAGLSYRSRFTPIILLVATLRAVWPVVVAILVVGMELALSGFLPAYIVLQLCLGTTATFVASIYMHELGHIVVLKNRSELHVLQRRMRIGIIHGRVPVRIEVISAIAGPVVGILTAASIGCCLWIASFTYAAAAACCVPWFHVFSLLPWHGDGLSLSDAIKERRTTYEQSTDCQKSVGCAR